LKKLDASIQRSSVRFECHLYRLHRRREGGGVHRSSLYGTVVGIAEEDLSRSNVTSAHVNFESSSQGKFHLAGVANGNSVGTSRRFYGTTERSETSIFEVDGHFLGGVIGSLPEFNVGVEGTSFGLEVYRDAVYAFVEGTGSEGSSLDGDGGDGVEDFSRGFGRVVFGHGGSRGGCLLHASVDSLFDGRDLVSYGRVVSIEVSEVRVTSLEGSLGSDLEILVLDAEGISCGKGSDGEDTRGEFHCDGYGMFMLGLNWLELD